MTFSENEHPRAVTGAFTDKRQTTPDIGIPRAADTGAVTKEILDSLTAQQIRSLHSELIERTGTVGLTVDRSEADYRMFEEPAYFGLNEQHIRDVAERVGGREALGKLVTDTDAWGYLDDVSTDDTSEVSRAIAEAIDEVEQGLS